MAPEPAGFSPQSFRDLVRMLEQHPEWRAELRRLVLSEDLLELPALVRELVQAQRRTEERLGALAEAQRRTEERLGALAEAQRRTEETLRAFIRRVDHMDEQIGSMRGQLLEMRYRTHSGSYFSRLLRRARVVSQDDLDDLLEAGAASGALSADDVDEVRRADLMVRGRRPDTDEDTFLVVEVSAAIDAHDVTRAARRAGMFARLRPAIAVVAGDWITPEAETIAKRAGVWQLLDGRAVDPQAA